MVDSGIVLIKYWLEVSREEQTRRLESRIDDPRRIWKLSDLDLVSYGRWYDYSRARDDMLATTDTVWAPWHVAHADDKKRARLNIITHLLGQVPDEPIRREGHLARRDEPGDYTDPREPPLHTHAVLTQDRRSTMTEVRIARPPGSAALDARGPARPAGHVLRAGGRPAARSAAHNARHVRPAAATCRSAAATRHRCRREAARAGGAGWGKPRARARQHRAAVAGDGERPPDGPLKDEVARLSGIRALLVVGK